MSARVLITGADGFVGSALLPVCFAQGLRVRGAVREAALIENVDPKARDAVEWVVAEDIHGQTDWQASLQDVDLVVHLAARVHVMQDEAADPLMAFREVNVVGTERLAREAARAGVKRFVFLSSVKVNGEHTGSKPFTEKDPAHPEDPYGVSKWEAEEALRSVSAESGLEVAIIRPCLVYGPGVKGNLERLLGWVAKGLPLPFGLIRNRRSLVSKVNLAHLILTCLTSPEAAGEVLLASDGEDVATPEIIRALAAGLGRKPALLPIPTCLLRLGLSLLGKGELASRLCGDLRVDASKARALGWSPQVQPREGLAEVGAWYASVSRSKIP